MAVKSEDFTPVVEACTLCDMCFMTKCPYVPPHPFNAGFPASDAAPPRGRSATGHRGVSRSSQLAEMDRNGRLARFASRRRQLGVGQANSRTPSLMEASPASTARRSCRKFHAAHLRLRDRGDPIDANETAPAFGKRKAALYATCFVNYNKPATGMAARAVLNHIGVETKVAYPGCCGMPFLEQANSSAWRRSAARSPKELVKLIDEGYDIVALTASCGLMLKFEWPLIVPEIQT